MNTHDIELPQLTVGALPTMNQDDYPGLGSWWVQLRTGTDNDEVFARVYGDSPEQAKKRAEALAAIEADRLKKEDYINDDRDMLRAEVVALKGTIADLEATLQSQDHEDSARLDWVERNARRDPDMGGNHTWWPTSFNKTICGPSLRDAIDHARRVEGDE